MPVHVSLQLLLAGVRLLAKAAAPRDVIVNCPGVHLVPVLVPLHVVKHLNPKVVGVSRIGYDHVGGRAVKTVDTFNTDRRINVPL